MNGEPAGDARARAATRAGDPLGPAGLAVSSALVAGLVLVHLGMAYSISTLPDMVYDLTEPLAGDATAELVVDVLPLVPLALVVLGVGLTVLRGSLAAAVVIAVALVAHESSSLWFVTALLPVGAALAWGVARRRGTWWLGGLVVAAAVAWLFRWLDLDVFSDDSALRAVFLAFVLHVVPAILAGLACWLLEWREEYR